MPHLAPMKTKDCRFGYVAAGDPGMPPLVFLHGIGGAARAWHGQLDFFKHRYRAIAWDMPGYGDSPPLEPMTFPALADSLVALLDARSIERAVVVGHSMGGMVAQELVARMPDRVAALVLDRGDVNLTFKRYLESAIRLTIADDYVTDVGGDGLDAELMRSYFAAWGDREAYAVSHVGWGMNPAARWDAMAMYDRGDFNGTELRAFAGNFLYSTGANESAGRHTLGHFDLPLRNCTVRLDDRIVVDEGRLQGELA